MMSSIAPKKIWKWIKMVAKLPLLLPRRFIRKAEPESTPQVDKALERKLAKRIQKRAVKAVNTRQGGPNMPKSQLCPRCRRRSKRVQKMAEGANYKCPEHGKFFVRVPAL
jgi:hypothetical protein